VAEALVGFSTPLGDILRSSPMNKTTGRLAVYLEVLGFVLSTCSPATIDMLFGCTDGIY